MNPSRVYRVCGTPVRTGCITCKKRHVKCDEGKPRCNRCIKAKRTCEGYLDLPPKPIPQTGLGISTVPPTFDVASLSIADPAPRHSSSSTSSSVRLTPQISPNSSSHSSSHASPSPEKLLPLIPALTQEEWYHLSHFIHSTAPSLSGYCTSTFYNTRVISALSSPSVLHGCIALSALHQHFSSGHLNTSLSAPPPGHSKHHTLVFALQQNNQAIRYLSNLMSNPSPTPESQTTTLLSCILFVNFDSFLSNYQSAMIHLRCGLQILSSLQQNNPESQSLIDEFAPQLLKLGVQSMMFLSPKDNTERYALWSELRTAYPTPSNLPFLTIESAENALYHLGASILYDRENASYTSNSQQLDEKHASDLAQWDSQLKDFLSRLNTNTPSTDSNLRTACLLKIYQQILSLVITIKPPTPLPPSTDPIFSAMLELCSIVDSAALAKNSTSTSPSISEEERGEGVKNVEFSAELGIVPPLFFTCMKCSNMKLRRKALGLLKGLRRREGMFDAGLCGEVVGKVLAMYAAAGGVNLGKEEKEREEGWVGWDECALHKEIKLRRKLAVGDRL